MENVCNEPSNAELFFNFPTKHQLLLDAGNFLLNRRNSFAELYKKLDACGKVNILHEISFFHTKISLNNFDLGLWPPLIQEIPSL